MAQAAGFSFNSETVTGSTVRDLAGYFLDGTIVGSAAIATSKTGYGNALHCTGGALQVKVTADTYPVNTSGGLTLAAWVKLDDTTASARCAVSLADAGAQRAALYASNASGNVEAQVMGTTYTTTTSIRDGGWHHIMFTLSRVSGPGAEILTIVVDGVQVQQYTALTTNFAYPSGSIVWNWGRNAFTGLQPLNGLIDDARVWNDPVSSASWTTLRDAEQVDLQWCIYPLDGSTSDLGIYGRNLTLNAAGSFVDGFYGKALQSTSAGAGASGAVNFGDLDRLALTGYMRLDTAPVGSAAPIMAITDSSGTNKFRAVVNTDRTVTLTWVTVYGTYTVTSGTALTAGVWTRYHFNMNPTYVGIRLGSDTQQQTNTSNSNPVLTPTVMDLKNLYIGGDSTAGGQVSFDYVNCTRNFLDVPKNNYWCGPANYTPQKPTNSARGVYEFNEGSGTTAADQGASRNNLTLTANGGWATGVQGSSLSNSGSVGPGARSTTLTWSSTPTGWAMSGWFKCRASSSGARIISMRNSGSEVAHAFYLSGAFQLRLYGSGGNTGILIPSAYPSDAHFPSETWTHLAAVCNGTTVQFYINGVRIGSTDYGAGTLLSPTTLEVGGDTTDGSGQEVADGVDSLLLFDTPLSDSNVRWLYQNTGSFAAGVPVSQTKATTWNTKAQVAGPRQLVWDTRTVVSGNRSTIWNVLGALIAVSASRSTTWNVGAGTTSVSASRATTWRLLQLASALRSLNWNVNSDIPGSGFTVKFPTYRVPLGTVPPLNRQWMDMPKALVKYKGEWLEVAVPYNELLLNAEKFYLGGYKYELSAEEVADLPPQYVEAITS